MKKYIFFSILSLSLFFYSFCYAEPIAVIGAMDSEIQYLLDSMNNVKQEQYAHIIFYTGTLNGKQIVLFKSGVGKVNATMSTTIAIEKYKVTGIIFTGVAGALSPQLNIGDIVISDYLVQHDYDVSALGEPKGDVPGSTNRKFYADPTLIRIAQRSAQKVSGRNNVYIGTIATGDQFIADKNKVNEIRKEFNASAVEMEGAAVAHVANLYTIPIVVIRSISDKADGSAHSNFTDFAITSASNAAKIVYDMMNSL